MVNVDIDDTLYNEIKEIVEKDRLSYSCIRHRQDGL